MAVSTESIQGTVFNTREEACKHGKGGIWYEYEDVPNPSFPENVTSVWINMPVCAGPGYSIITWLSCEWTVNRRNFCGAKWSLSGTYQKPTLSPSLNWVDTWHGFLQEGFLKSC